MNILRNVFNVKKDLSAGNDIRKGFNEFSIIERGKTRNIKSVHFSERVIQKSLCTNALIPYLMPGLIYDNGASVKGKGIHFAIKRLKTHLTRFYRRHGREGYVLLIDFRKYFDNILHQPLRKIYEIKFGCDERLLNLGMLFIYAFGESGIGLGSETSQINAVAYSNRNDHYIKEVLRCKNYGRYLKQHLQVGNDGKRQLNIPAWKKEAERLTTEITQLYKQYYSLKEDVRQIEIVKTSVEHILDRVDVKPIDKAIEMEKTTNRSRGLER
jgi:hypothetical protein